MTQANDILIGARISSLGDRCPRCRQKLTTVQMDSGVMLERCHEGHYEARTVTGESRLAWHEAVNSGLRLGRGRLYR